MIDIIQRARELGGPLAFDFFCGGGGASMGLIQAGFTVIAVDIDPKMVKAHFQHERVFIIQGDAIEIALKYGRCGDFCHFSPPCQKFSSTSKLNGKEYPSGELLHKTLELAPKLGVLYSIENVPGAAKYMTNPIMLCGAMFPELNVYRHRYFQCNFPVPSLPHPKHTEGVTELGRKPEAGKRVAPVGHFSDVLGARKAMGMPWADQKVLAQAIPPAYMKYIAEYALRYINGTV